MADDFSGRTVLAVFAHPDDESLACGGTLARLADAGAQVVLLCASRGERGWISDASLVADGDLAHVRAGELDAAARVLGLAEVLLFDHPDGDLRWAHVPQLHAEILAAIERYHPAAVITFAEDGLYWHLDHIGVHERTYTAVQSLGDAAPALYYVTMPNSVMRDVVQAAKADGWVPPSAGFWGLNPFAFGDGATPPGFVVDVRDWVPRKLAALRCHRTQIGANSPFCRMDEADARRCLGVEQFRRETFGNPIAGAAVLEPLAEPVASS